MSVVMPEASAWWIERQILERARRMDRTHLGRRLRTDVMHVRIDGAGRDDQLLAGDDLFEATQCGCKSVCQSRSSGQQKFTREED